MMTDLCKTLRPYQKEPLKFCNSILKMHLIWKGQRDILESYVKYPITVVPSGHSCGKSAIAAAITLHWLSTRYKARVIVTAPSWRQLSTVYYAEVNKWYNKSIIKKFSMFNLKNNIMQINDENLKREWYMLPISPKNPEALQGQHGDKSAIVEELMEQMGITKIEDDATIEEITRLLKDGNHTSTEDNLLVMIDEASGVDDRIMEVLEGTDANRTVIFGNMTRTDGFFYEWAYNTQDKALNVVRLNSEESPFMSKDQAESIARRYGKDSNVYRVRIQGLPPDSTENTVIPRGLLEKSIGITTGIAFEGYEIMGVDVARYGGDHTVGYRNTGELVALAFEYEKKSTMNCVGEISRWCRATPEKEHYLFIDAVGVGGPVVDRLRELIDEDYDRKDEPGYLAKVPGLEIVEINNGSNKVFEPNEFANTITEMHFHLKEQLEKGLVPIPDDKDLIQELSTRQYEFKSDGTIIVEKKDKVKERLKRSPDKSDAFLQTIYGTKFI